MYSGEARPQGIGGRARVGRRVNVGGRPLVLPQAAAGSGILARWYAYAGMGAGRDTNLLNII